MRISDWSSDVCSSDLRRRPGTGPDRLRDTVGQDRIAERTLRLARSRDRALLRPALCRPPPSPLRGLGLRSRSHGADAVAAAPPRRGGVAGGLSRRSEAHTSELQSLIRIYFAVFCFNNKPQNAQTPHRNTI